MSLPEILHRRGTRLGTGVVAWLVFTTVLAFGSGSAHLQGLVVMAGLNAMLALSFILLTGYAGQFSLAQGAFMGCGAYASGLLTVRSGWPPLVAMVVAAAGVGLMSAMLGRPIFRLKGHFLAMGTLALGEIIYVLLNNWSFSGGSSGFGGIPPFSLFGFDFVSLPAQIVLIWTAMGLSLWMALQLGSHREGRALRALRSSEVAAGVSGVNPATSKTKVFVFSTVVASVSGSLYAHYMMFVNPPPFNVMVSINILVVAVIGGLRSPWGAVVGAVVFTGINEGITSAVPKIFGQQAVGAGETFVVGAMLIVVLVLMPDGIMGLAGRLGRTRTPVGGPDFSTLAPDVPVTDAALADGLPSLAGGVAAAPVARKAGSTEPVVRCVGITRRFGGVTALKDVSLEVRPGEILAVIGPNGAGKSTLVNILTGVDAPTSGQVIVNGQDLTGSPSHTFARTGVTRTFQTPTVFDGMSVRENVMVGAYLQGAVGFVRSMLPTPGAVREDAAIGAQVRDILASSGLSDLADLDGAQLSLGQQKILEIARALALRGDAILLDEPAAGLTRVEKLQLAGVLRSLADAGTALLLIEHDMELVMSVSDRMHVLNFGQTLATGSPQEIQQDQSVIDAYLGVDEPEEVGVADHA